MGIINTNNKQKKILETVYPYKEHINTIRAWEAYRKVNPKLELPSSKSIKRDFNSWNNFKISLGIEINRSVVVNKKEEYIHLLTPHKEYLRTMDGWNEYIKLQTGLTLPSSETLTKKFKSWNELLSSFGLEKEWSNEEYIQLLAPYKEHLITMASWETYRNINDAVKLPDSITICAEFENWENVKNALKIDDLEKEKLNVMLAPHISELNTMEQWDIYRQQHPEYKNSALTKDEFINIIKHKNHLKTKAYWEAYRMENPELNLLSSAVLINRFT